MYRLIKKLVPFRHKNPPSLPPEKFLINPNIQVAEEVRFALETGKPLVALESTIITHGMPFPENVKCAIDVETIIRKKGAIPATVAIINGNIKLGLSEEELQLLGDTKISKPVKVSRRDFPYVVSNKQNGGTTVTGTLIVANMAGIPIFATGGIGGVHRGANKTFDISADLPELARCGIAVVSSGVKSILDIPKTLEYLETMGVFVATFGDSKEFPAFYSRVSGSKSPYCVGTASEAAKIIKSTRDLDLRSGMLFAVPVPEEYAFPLETMNNIVEEALKSAKNQLNLMGKDLTPFLLSQIKNITGGKSLQTNIALIQNNAKTAAEIAVALAELEILEKNSPKGQDPSSLEKLKGRPIVIGGSNLDCSATLKTSEIKLDGRIHEGHFSYTAGGVGRNICESLCKLGCPPNFISAIGDDEQGRLLKSLIPSESSRMLKVVRSYNSAQCIIVFDKIGECKLLMGDMGIHNQITPEMIRSYESFVQTAPIIILDGNLNTNSIGEALRLAEKYSIPVIYEPTDVELSAKPFETPHWKAVKFVTPNLNELKYMASFLNIPTVADKTFCNKIEEAASISKQLSESYLENVIVTLGQDGVLVARKGLATDPFLRHEQRDEVHVRHYPTKIMQDFVNVSGAGDCLVSGIVAAMLCSLPEEKCLSVGFAAAHLALYSQSAVPKEIFDRTHPAWNSSALYNTIF